MADEQAMPKKVQRGFVLMSPQKRRAIASMGERRLMHLDMRISGTIKQRVKQGKRVARSAASGGSRSNNIMTDRHHARDLEDLYGPLSRYSDHKRGEHITFRDGGNTITGEILWICAPGPVSEGGPARPAHYAVQRDVNPS